MEVQPFTGVKVLQFGQFVAVPYACQMLADGGAYVIKIEPREGEAARFLGPSIDQVTRHFLIRNRGSHSLPIDLRNKHSTEIIQGLLKKCDVVLTNLRPGLAEELGIDHASLEKEYPRIISGNVTAFGKKGLDASLPGMDLVVQARSGLMAMNGGMENGRPTAGGSPIIDYMCASILAFGITSALLRREKTGKGGYVDVSLLMSSLVLQNNMISRLESLDAERYDTFLNWIEEARKDGVPFSEQVKKMPGVRDSLLQSVYYRTYETRDSAIAIACASVPLRKRLLAAINMKDEVLEGVIAKNEVRNYYHVLSKKIEALFLSRDTSEWVSIFASEGIPAQPVKFPVEMLTDEQVEANSLVIHREHESAGKIAFLNTPLSLDEDGFVAESTGANFIMIENGKIVTPELRNLLRGASMMYIIETLAPQLRIEVIHKNFDLYDVMNCDEAMFTGTFVNLLPCNRLNGRYINDNLKENPFGPITKKIADKWSENVGVDFIEQMKYWHQDTGTEDGFLSSLLGDK